MTDYAEGKTVEVKLCWCGSGKPAWWEEGRGWGCREGGKRCYTDPATVPDWPVDDHWETQQEYEEAAAADAARQAELDRAAEDVCRHFRYACEECAR